MDEIRLLEFENVGLGGSCAASVNERRVNSVNRPRRRASVLREWLFDPDHPTANYRPCQAPQTLINQSTACL